jgi:hypothetical protein
MSETCALEYKRVENDNFKKYIARKQLHKSLKIALKEKPERSVILLESPAENYIQANFSSIEYLLNNGYKGIYISFQRPYKNIYNMFSRNGLNMKKILVFDGATGFCGEKIEKQDNCIFISPEDGIKIVIKNIVNEISKINSSKRFVFIDSLSTMAFYESFIDTTQFSEALINSFNGKKFEDVKILFNIAESLCRRRYVENVSVYADDHIHLGLNT